MKYLEEEINNRVIDKTTKKDLEENEMEDMDIGLEFDEDSMNQAIIEFNKSKYLYEETENPFENIRTSGDRSSADLRGSGWLTRCSL